MWSCDRHPPFRDGKDQVKHDEVEKRQQALIQEFFRLQLQGELQSKKDAPRLYKGVFHGVSVIFKNEGAKGLFRGIGAAVYYSIAPLPNSKA